MAATAYTPTRRVLSYLASLLAPVDGDAVSRANLYVETSTAANLTLGILLDYVAALFCPITSDRGVLAGPETLALGSQEYSYDTVAANRDVTLPDGTFHGQRIMIRGTMKNPSFKIEFGHAGSATVPITFAAAATVRRPWAVLEWSTTGTDQWHVISYGGGAELP